MIWEEYILSRIQKYARLCAGNESESRQQIAHMIISQYSSSNSLLDKKIQKLELSIQEINTCIIDAFDHAYEGTIEYSRYKLLLSKFETQLQKPEAKHDSIQNQRVNVDALLEQIDDFITQRQFCFYLDAFVVIDIYAFVNELPCLVEGL